MRLVIILVGALFLRKVAGTRIDDELRSADRARESPPGFYWHKTILFAPEYECGHRDALHIPRHEIVLRCLEAAERGFARALHAREIPIAIDHPVVDNCLAYDCIIESFDNKEARCHVKKRKIKHRNPCQPEGKRCVVSVVGRHADGVHEDKLGNMLGIFLGKVCGDAATHRVSSDRKTRELQPVRDAGHGVRHRLLGVIAGRYCAGQAVAWHVDRNDAECIADRMSSGRTCGARRRIRPSGSESNRNLAGREIDNA